MRREGETVWEKVFRYRTLSFPAREKTVSSGFEEGVNSLVTSSSTMYLPGRSAQRMYSCRLAGDAEISLGKLR